MTPIAGMLAAIEGGAILSRTRVVSTRLATLLFLITTLTAGYFLYVWLLRLTSGIPSTVGISAHLLPADALTLTACSVGFLFADPYQHIVRTFASAQPGSAFARRILSWSMATLLGCGAVRTALQAYHFVNLQEGTGLMVLAAVMVLGAVLHNHTRLLNQTWWAERRTLRSLQKVLHERQALVDQVEQERRRIDAVLAAAVDYSIIATNIEGRIIVFNEGASLMLGYTPEETVNKRTPLDFHDYDELAERARALNVDPGFDVFRVVPNYGRADAREWTYVRKDGRRLPVWLSVTTLLDKDGGIAGYVSVARDLSLEKRSQRDREGLLNIGQELLCLADRRGVLHLASPSFARVTGYSPPDLVGRGFFEFVKAEDHAKTHQCFSQVEKGQAVQRFENRWCTRDGRQRIISWDLSPPDSDGMIFASGWDVTDEQARAHKLQRHLDFEQHLIGIVSHDLRNPVAAISLSAEAIARQSEHPDKVLRLARRISRASGRATRMIHDLLDFTQARLGGGLHVEIAPVDLQTLLGQVVDELQASYPLRRINLEMPPMPNVEGDADRLAQLFSNLLNNSLKYGQADMPVMVSGHAEKQICALAVHNKGPPIPADLMPHLFSPLHRGPNKSCETDRSIGLGLYIASEVARAHGGSISVESTAEAGTTFIVHLPLLHSDGSANAVEK